MKSRSHFSRQFGFTLIELSIALAVMIGIASIKLWADARAMVDDMASTQADDLVAISNAVGNYQTQYFDKLIGGTAITGFPAPLAPTVAQLTAGGFLSNVSANNLYGGGYNVQIQTVAVPGPPAGTDLRALTCLTTPIISNGRVDRPSLGTAVNRAGGNAGFSTDTAPGTINGSEGAWTATNPITVSSTPQAGILCMRSGYGSSGLSQLTRRDGTTPPTANWNMGNVNVTGIGNLGTSTMATASTATIGGVATTTGIVNNGNLTNSGTLTTTGTLTASSNATVGGTLGVTGQTTTRGLANIAGNITNSGNTTLSGTLDVAGATTTKGITNTGNISTTGDVVTGRMQLTTIVANGASCAGFSGYQAATAAGSLASCINGTWQTPSASVPPPNPCAATSVSFSGCTGNLPYTTSGSTANVTMTTGTGWATYSCSNGSWAYQSGSCTPPPVNCSARSFSWSGSASCSGSVGTTSHGGGQWISSTNGNNGDAYVSCNNGTWSISNTSCTAPAVGCSATSVSFGGCSGNVPSASSGQIVNVSMTSGSGWGQYSCNNGSWSYYSGSCTPPPPKCPGGTQYWGSSVTCAAWAPEQASGSGQWLTSANSYEGSIYSSCTNGVRSLSNGTCAKPKRYVYNPTTVEGHRIAHDPNRLTLVCQKHYPGSVNIYGESVATDYRGVNIRYCGTIDGNLNCSPPTGTNTCTDPAFNSVGCWLMGTVVCQ
ncbi:prepilin-type N-terminal cleavage/methylation domain-containing protein [Noviherbaspirillum malthae]|uniref:prepilin-type N-terminal cleavage/methylation domain-containing protein n=1 Tax=Noviherbaspirillum malthae TaxID=1260987 RepID=UPI00188E25A0|nr:prepilin-type N-terminal cleavage/methylation domain-containing protein [Noviherbaspirillum malthae]